MIPQICQILHHRVVWIWNFSVSLYETKKLTKASYLRSQYRILPTYCCTFQMGSLLLDAFSENAELFISSITGRWVRRSSTQSRISVPLTELLPETSLLPSTAFMHQKMMSFLDAFLLLFVLLICFVLNWGKGSRVFFDFWCPFLQRSDFLNFAPW